MKEKPRLSSLLRKSSETTNSINKDSILKLLQKKKEFKQSTTTTTTNEYGDFLDLNFAVKKQTKTELFFPR